MQRDQNFTIEIEDYCKKIGVDVVGFADPNLFNRFSEENRPQAFLNDVKTVIIIGFHLYDLTLDAWNYLKVENRSYQFADSLITNFCHKVKDKLTQSGYISVVIPYSPGLYLKDSAALAGIGPIGKNNLLITPDYGSQIRLRAIVTTAPLICGEPLLESEYCKECDICMRACPANAFIDGKYTKNICNEWARANWEILSKHTVIWCNVCIEECPVTKKRKS
jgi:epoxyqueuosine reductase QueG